MHDLVEGTFLFTRVSYDPDSNSPYLRIMNSKGEFQLIQPQGDFTLSFDTNVKRCIGWYDLATKQCHRCPGDRQIDDKYEQCPECQQKTGFNPAFYNTTDISQQQTELNKQPHILYLAYFSPDVVKVGISYAERKLARLLEQGARNAAILETFPSANIARQYEAKIARLPGLCESVQLRKKAAILANEHYDSALAEQILRQTIKQITEQLGVDFDNNELLDLSPHMFAIESIDNDLTEITEPMIAGYFVGLVGSMLVMQQNDRFIFLPLKKYIGYDMNISRTVEQIDLAPVQASLF